VIIATVMLFASSAAWALFNLTAVTMRQRQVPAALLGRVSSLCGTVGAEPMRPGMHGPHAANSGGYERSLTSTQAQQADMNDQGLWTASTEMRRPTGPSVTR
jgi:hypothetical protein